MYGIIYKFVNKESGKSYVGLTTLTLEERLKDHWDKANKEKSYFQRSLKKNGKKAFDYFVIDTASSKEELIAKEIFWIKFYNTLAPNGYNLTTGGDGGMGHTQETRDKIAKTKTGVPNLKARGKLRTQEQKNNISRSMGATPILAKNESTGETIYLHSVTDGKYYGFNPSLISAVVLGNRPRHKGYIFSRISDANTEITLDNKKSKAS